MQNKSDKAYTATLLIALTLFFGVIQDNNNMDVDYLTDTNLAPMFQGGTGLADGCRWGDYHLHGDVYYDAVTNPQLCHRDDSVVSPSGYSSIRVEGPPTVYNGAREVNHQWHRVYPGDRVIFKMWMKTAPLAYGSGAIFGFDCFGAYDRILEVHKCVPDQTAIWNVVNGVPTQGGTAVYVPYGSDWTQVTIDVTIPDYTYTYADGGGLLPHGAQQIVGIAPWITGSWNQGETASVWFADAELYINPSDPFVEQVQAPLFDPVSGVYGSTQTVTISSATSGASLYYTKDGSTPTSMDFEYTVPISIEYTTTVKALATKSGYTDSAVSTALYTINNPVTPSAAAVRAHLAMLRRR